MPTIYFVRDGLSKSQGTNGSGGVWNRYAPLSEEGAAQAECVRTLLQSRGCDFRAARVPHIRRAAQTADIIVGGRIPVIESDLVGPDIEADALWGAAMAAAEDATSEVARIDRIRQGFMPLLVTHRRRVLLAIEELVGPLPEFGSALVVSIEPVIWLALVSIQGASLDQVPATVLPRGSVYAVQFSDRRYVAHSCWA